MRLSFKLSTLMLCASVLCGCATIQYPHDYRVEGEGVKEFKNLTDDQALKVVALIYNIPQYNWEDSMARSIALNEYVELLKKRNSSYIKKSGIFESKYEKVDISKWKDGDLLKLYDDLNAVSGTYYMESGQQLTENENAKRLAYLTSLGAIKAELTKRKTTRGVVGFASNLLVGALLIAVSMI